MKSISGKCFKQLLTDNNINIIDIRNKEDYCSDHLYNSINIPYQNLIENYIKYLNKNKTYYLICEQGVQSKKASLFLTSLGYNVINVIDGIDNL